MGSILIIGLGPGDMDLISHGGLKALQSGKKTYLRTCKHPIVEDLKNFGICFDELDYFYEKEEAFDQVYDKISRFIVDKGQLEDIIYAVPGHPRVAEMTVSLIEEYALAKNIKVDIIPSMSFVDAMFNYLSVDPVYGFKLMDALNIDKEQIDTSCASVITQVYDKYIASNVKLKLMEYYHEEEYIYVVKGAGIKSKEEKHKIKLYEMDRYDIYDYLTSIYIPISTTKMRYEVKDLEDIMIKLRSEDGCPWDKKQTHESLKTHIIEEAYELLNAIDNKDTDEIIEELGDILLHVVFHSQIGKESGYFNITDVCESICKKLTYRHPHVFKGENINEDDYLKKWEELKKEEKGEETITQSLKRIPNHLPALMKAHKVQHKASLVGFDWDDIADVYKKIEEEYKEVIDAHRLNNIEYIEEELGDLLFSVVNLTRFLNVEPEEALNKTTKKFIKRFNFIEDTAIKMNKSVKDMTLEEMDNLWNLSKKL